MSFELLYGQSRDFARLVETIDQYARCPWPVLILGETGVGKELIARRVHEQSPRAAGPFVPLNCGAIPHGLFESELFGYERGAFSGATQSAKGLVRQAQGGTLFLDEIGELEPSLQVKLLRLLELGELRALGSVRVEQVNVRIVAATNTNLSLAARHGRFRADLLERLSVLTARVPPLRERPEDIPMIARHILAGLDAKWPDEALNLLFSYDWPGNVRQLRNVLVRAVVQGRGQVCERGLREILREVGTQETASAASRDFREGSLAEIEKQVIVERLRKCHGNRKKTAEGLGIAKSTLHEKLRRWKDEEEQGIESWPVARLPARPLLGH